MANVIDSPVKIVDVQTAITSAAEAKAAATQATAAANAAQPKLVSGENIKTINGQSLLGSGNIEVTGGGGGGGIPDAPADGNQHARQDNNWTRIYSALDNAKAGGYTGTQEQFNSDLASIQGLVSILQGV